MGGGGRLVEKRVDNCLLTSSLTLKINVSNSLRFSTMTSKKYVFVFSLDGYDVVYVHYV